MTTTVESATGPRPTLFDNPPQAIVALPRVLAGVTPGRRSSAAAASLVGDAFVDAGHQRSMSRISARFAYAAGLGMAARARGPPRPATCSDQLGPWTKAAMVMPNTTWANRPTLAVWGP